MLRHGDAEDQGADDASRHLTPKGERQAVAAGVALAGLDAGIETCLTSPKARALETARIACEALGIEPEVQADFSRAIQLTTGSRVEMKKGGLAAIDESTLISLLRPGQLRRIAHM